MDFYDKKNIDRKYENSVIDMETFHYSQKPQLCVGQQSPFRNYQDVFPIRNETVGKITTVEWSKLLM